jgi:hypothetical protein
VQPSPFLLPPPVLQSFSASDLDVLKRLGDEAHERRLAAATQLSTIIAWAEGLQAPAGAGPVTLGVGDAARFVAAAGDARVVQAGGFAVAAPNVVRRATTGAWVLGWIHVDPGHESGAMAGMLDEVLRRARALPPERLAAIRDYADFVEDLLEQHVADLDSPAQAPVVESVLAWTRADGSTTDFRPQDAVRGLLQATGSHDLTGWIERVGDELDCRVCALGVA